MRKHWAGHTRDRGQRTEEEEHLPDMDNTQTEGWTDRNLELSDHSGQAFTNFIINAFSVLTIGLLTQSLAGTKVRQFIYTISDLCIISVVIFLSQALHYASVQKTVNPTIVPYISSISYLLTYVSFFKSVS